MTFCIYGIFNPKSGRYVYVGQSGSVSRRWKGYDRGLNLAYALGLRVRPECKILQRCRSRRAALRLERFWIMKLTAEGNSLINKRKGIAERRTVFFRLRARERRLLSKKAGALKISESDFIRKVLGL